MPRFVILRHETPPGASRPLHWDLMLEQHGVLATWSLPSEPDLGQSQVGQRLADHRIAYLDLEGPLSGDRGSVTRWDEGVYEPEACGEATRTVHLKGRRLCCVVEIEPIEGTVDAVRIRIEPRY